jgi:ubiquinone/menaquinone biosynthesis C-methylase UbiE
MDARLQNRIQRYGWNRAAGLYDGAWTEQLRPGHDMLMQMVDLKPGSRVVDVACGTGSVSLRAADAVGPRGFVLGTDISEAMVESAARLAEGRPNLAWRRLEADAPALDGAGFDAAICAFGLMYVPDPVAALGAMRRALAPQGRAGVVVWGPRARCGWAGVFPIVDSRVESDVCPLFFQLGMDGALESAMGAAGFTDVTVRRIRTTLRYPSAGAALEAAFAAGPVALAYGRFAPDVRAAAHAEYLDSIAPYRNGETYALPGEFVAAVGRCPASGAPEQ